MPSLRPVDHVDRVEAAIASREVADTVDDWASLRGHIVGAVPTPDDAAGRRVQAKHTALCADVRDAIDHDQTAARSGHRRRPTLSPGAGFHCI